MTGHFQTFVLAVAVILLSGQARSQGDASSATRLVAMGAPLRQLVEADWQARDGGCSLDHARHTLARGHKLAARLRSIADRRQLRVLEEQLQRLDTRLVRLAADSRRPAETERALWLEAHQLVRDIAFCNPRLREIDRLLFITRHDAGGVFHMVDQFYGFNARPGGRMLVMVDLLGSDPKLADLLAGSAVQNGRLQGRTLDGGAFLAPEVSFDGKTILFAWTEAQGKDLEWSPAASYHIFKVNADGTGLVQLTDGSWNDFDPCFLPNGRIAFVSERRGGFLRCGRYCPTYTMFGMDTDGRDIVCLSFHETHEWHPSIAADGRIVYTRWDYVDRDTNMAHHPWTCRPNGADARAIHGNYPQRRESRPWMEMDVRAIPGSQKFVAVAAAHHGHAFGSLVMVDPQIEDDGAASQLTRLTPEVPFPEAEKHLKPIAECMVYGTPWPLSEDDYLCVYDPAAKNRGLYWMDRFGNKELLYRDPAISCLSPMPLQPRPKPPVIPDGTSQTVAAQRREATTTIAVMDVYDSDFAWPAGTKVTALRVIQVLPKSTPAPNDPRIGVADQTNARAVLGTVPVEEDGSAYFEAPPGKQMYFQALDERGMAVQSMRSGTYVHRGEQLTCQGCHEPRHRAPRRRENTPLALRREPSKIQPAVDGSHPFNFVRLVQPVLDRNCVDCHREQQALDLRGVVEGKHGWTRAYSNLAGKYGFYFHVSNGAINSGVHGGSRTIAGQFGARASPLLPYLDGRHYDVRLSPEDWQRVTLWLDCNSEFYGSYENTQAQARGEVVWPALQ
ncbi:MAG: PD40 domain-containing protein [Verrucomicrobia bacterium]|nr:PD40 domain-containing protein [Verrucomicrobiota bacterium]